MDLPEYCSLCGAAQDGFGDHVLCCKATGVYGRHNAIRDTLADLLRECGCECRTEVPLPGSSLRPADVFTPAFPGESAMAIDVSAVHLLPLSLNASATVSAGAAAHKREIAKVVQYGEKCSHRAWGFTAFVGETTGAWGPAAQRTVRALVRAKSLRSGDAPEEIARTFWDVLGRAMATGVARQLVKARTLSGTLGSRSSVAARPGSAVHRGQAQVSPSSAAGGPPPEASQAVLEDAGPVAGDLVLARALCC
jgi:hypothetical protein